MATGGHEAGETITRNGLAGFDSRRAIGRLIYGWQPIARRFEMSEKFESVKSLSLVLARMEAGENLSVRRFFFAPVPFMGTRDYKHTLSSDSWTGDNYRRTSSHEQSVKTLAGKIAEMQAFGIDNDPGEYFEVSTITR